MDRQILHLQGLSKPQTHELAMLNRAGQAINSSLDLESVLAQIMAEVNAFFQATGASVLLHDPVENDLIFSAVGTADAEPLLGTRFPAMLGIAGWVFQHKRPILLDDAQSDPRFYAKIDAVTGLTTRSLLAVSLIMRDKAIGIIEVINKPGDHFTQHDLVILEILAASAAIAIENARLYDEVARHVRQLKVLHELDRALTTSLRFDDIYHAFLVHAGRLLAYDCTSINLVEGETIRPVYTAGAVADGPAPNTTLANRNSVMAWVITHCQPLLRHNISTAYFTEDSQLVLMGIRSYIVVPLRVTRRIIGTWNIGSSQVGGYRADDLQVAQSMADQLAITIENARLFEQVRAGHEQMRQVAQQAISAQEEERQRLSHELHDEAGQALTVLKIWLESIQDDLPPHAETIYERIGEAVELTNTTMMRLRALARNLRPPALDVSGLNEALQDLCSDFSRRTHLIVEYTGCDLPEVSDLGMICLYRFLQEGLTNVAKHARATHVWVCLDRQQKAVRLSVQDDGLGFAGTGDQTRPRKGIGLVGIQERLELLAGRLEIESTPGQGTTVIACIPEGALHD